MVREGSSVVDVSVDAIREILLSGYGLVPSSLSVVSGELATVCRAVVDDRLLAVKTLPGSESEGQLVEWQTAAMAAVLSAGLPVPSVTPTLSGALVYPSARTFTVVSSWLTDPPLAALRPSPSVLRAVGVCAGRVSLALSGFARPPVTVSHEWELMRSAASISAVLPSLEPSLAALVSSVASSFEADALPLLAGMPQQVVHHDLHDDNLLISSAGEVSGILDFGDLVVGPAIAELIVAAAYASRLVSEPVSGVREVAAGWASVKPLSSSEETLLLPGVRARLAVNAAIWAARASGPRSEYADSRSRGTVETLERLMEVDA